jgi:hypothetical protein
MSRNFKNLRAFEAFPELFHDNIPPNSNHHKSQKIDKITPAKTSQQTQFKFIIPSPFSCCLKIKV